MSVVPVKPVDRLQFYEAHLPPFTTNAVAIGTTTEAVADLETKTQAARAALDAHVAAQQSAKTKSEAYRNAIRSMSVAGASILKQVRAKAQFTGDNNVYELAQIPAPAIPGPIQPPGEPTNLKCSLDGDGALILKWKANNPVGASGTVYVVWRQFDGQPWENLAITGVRKFTDFTIPAGMTRVTYKIRGVRSTSAGPWTQFVVQFGTNAGGHTTATILSDAVQPKLAA